MQEPEEIPVAFAKVAGGEVVETVNGAVPPAGMRPVYVKRPQITLGQKLGAPVYVIFADRVEQGFEVVQDADAVERFRAKLINEVRTLGFKQARHVYPSITDIGTLKFVHDFVLSVNPDARSLTPDLIAAQAVYDSTLSAITTLEAADTALLMNYDVNTTPRWP